MIKKKLLTAIVMATGLLVTSAAYADNEPHETSVENSQGQVYRIINNAVLRKDMAAYNAGVNAISKYIENGFENNNPIFYNNVPELNGMQIGTDANVVINNSNFKFSEPEESEAALSNEGILIVNNSNFNGNDIAGRAIYNKGVYFSDPTTYEDLHEEDGAAIYNDYDSYAVVQGDIFIHNTADNRGGAIYNVGTLEVEIDNDDQPLFERNEAYEGGAIYNGVEAYISGTTLKQNQAYVGGALYNDYGAEAAIKGDTFTGNSAETTGGSVYNDGILVIGSDDEGNQTVFTQNSAYDGGAIYSDVDAVLTIQNTDFTANESENSGGALLNAGTLTIELDNEDNRTSFSKNTSNQGGALYNDVGANANIKGTTFTQNTATYRGGGIYNDGSLTVQTENDESLIFSENAANEGAAIYNQGALVINALGSATLFDSNVSGSTDGSHGGGALYNAAGASAEISNAIFSNNSDGIDNRGIGGGGYRKYR